MAAVKRGDVVIVSFSGDYGKPRPALVVQIDQVSAVLDSVILCPMTTASDGASFVRVPVDPASLNGLRARSYVMTDKIMTIRRDRLDEPVGAVDASVMRDVERSLCLILGIVST